MTTGYNATMGLIHLSNPMDGGMVMVRHMIIRPKALPPMSTLRPFEAAARRLSFSKAADEIGVTQAAVSKQVRALEQHLGRRLFLRRGRHVELTSQGQTLFQAVSLGLSHIARATSQIRHHAPHNAVSIAMRLAFASQFMASRLVRLRTEFPDVAFNIVSTERNPFFLMDSVDMAIVLGFEAQPGLDATYLLTEEIFPVCSPGFLKRHPGLKTIQDIPDHDLIHLSAEHWRDLTWEPVDWPVAAPALGVRRDIEMTGPVFNNFEMLMSAAVSGLGLAITWRHLSKELLDQGHLVRPFKESYRINRQHFFVTHVSSRNDQLVGALRDWFVAETACFRED